MNLDKNTADLIHKLKGELKPVKPLPSPIFRWGAWFAFSLVIVILLMLWVHPFHLGLTDILEHPFLAIETFLAFSSTVTCAYLAYLMCLPGRKVSKGLMALAMLPLALFLIMLVAETSGLSASMDGKRGFCDIEILVFSWVPISFMLFQLKKGYPFFAKRAGLLVGLAGTAFPLALMQMACMYSPQHVLLAHFLPVVFTVFAAVVVAHVLFKTGKRSAL